MVGLTAGYADGCRLIMRRWLGEVKIARRAAVIPRPGRDVRGRSTG
jgi:hypothetical protein